MATGRRVGRSLFGYPCPGGLTVGLGWLTDVGLARDGIRPRCGPGHKAGLSPSAGRSQNALCFASRVARGVGASGGLARWDRCGCLRADRQRPATPGTPGIREARKRSFVKPFRPPAPPRPRCRAQCLRQRGAALSPVRPVEGRCAAMPGCANPPKGTPTVHPSIDRPKAVGPGSIAWLHRPSPAQPWATVMTVGSPPSAASVPPASGDLGARTCARPMRTHDLGGSCEQGWAASDIAGGMPWTLVARRHRITRTGAGPDTRRQAPGPAGCTL